MIIVVTYFPENIERGISNNNQRNRKYLQPPSSGVSSLGLHSYAGKASYVGKTETEENSEYTNNPAKIAVVRPRPQQRNTSISSIAVETGRDSLPSNPPRTRKWYNLYGVIDTEKLGSLFGRGSLLIIKKHYKKQLLLFLFTLTISVSLTLYIF